MAIIQKQVISVQTEDTDTWTPEQWKTFIKENVPSGTILKAQAHPDPWEWLKAQALRRYKFNQDFAAEFGLK